MDNIQTTLQKSSIEAISIYDWTYHEIPDDNGESTSNKTILLAWGLNQQSKPSLIRIEDFPFSCYIELPEKIHQQKVRELGDWLRKVLREDAPISISFKEKRKLYYFRNQKTYPMLKVEFSSLNALRHCEKLLAKECNTPIGKRSLPVYEHKISSIRKLLTERNLLYSGWITGKFEQVDFDDKITKMENEYRCSYKTLRQPTPEELEAKTTYPAVFSFDIECYSSNPKAMPNKTNVSDVIFAISCIYSRMGDKTRQRYLLAIGENLTVQNAILIQVKDEYELLTEFRKLIQTLDPDILIGYNIFGFDIPYTDNRIKRFMEDWMELGRIKGVRTSVKKLSWESSAFGHNDFYQFQGMDGRICLDLLPAIKRDYKLLRYDLDFVSNNFLGKGKFPIKAKQIFGYTKEYNEARKTRLEDPERYDKALLDYNKILDYCVQDSDLVLDLMEKLSMWIGLIELSNIVGVSIVDIFTRGQQIRCLSQIYDLATRENIVLDNRVVDAAISFSGGFVQEPIPGLYDNVICLDFASLYPSIIMAFNICYTTLLEKETEMEDGKVNHFYIDMDASEVDDGKEDESPIDENNKEERKEGKIKAHHRFVKKDVYEGVLPRLVSKLVNERRAVRKVLEGNKDPIMKIILDKRQLALKVSANSVFGFLGVANGKLPLMEGAMSITAKGRELIGQVNTYLEEKYNGKIVYNDSVAEYTPVLVRINGEAEWIEIKELFEIDIEKKFLDRGDIKERYLVEGIEIWSDKGWTKIKEIIRHNVSKRMFRIKTGSGCVDVTEDHSLIDVNGNKISPKDCKIGTELLHHDLPFGIKFSINTTPENLKPYANDAFWYHNNLNYQSTPIQNKIESIEEIEYDGKYVYDIETENHHFSAGVGRLIVHNTDSSMVDLGIKDTKLCNEWGYRLSSEISKLFPPPLVLEYEKSMTLLALKKKKYAAFLVDKHGNLKKNKKDILVRGIILARRDTLPWLQSVYSDLLYNILCRQTMEMSLKMIYKAVEDMMSGNFDVKGIVIVRQLSAFYKSETYFLNVFAKRLKSLGHLVNAGDRLEYLIVKNSGEKLLGNRMVTLDMYLEGVYELDTLYYLDHNFKNPIDQLFSVGHKEELKEYEDFGFCTKRKFLCVSKPIAMMTEAFKNGYKLEDVKKFLSIEN
jgi:DNA polymerase elongation subunit (family B)